MSDAMTLRNINEMKRLMANIRGDIQTTGTRAKGMQEFVESIGVYTNVNPLTSTKHLEQTQKVVSGITEAFDAGYKGQGIGGHRAVYREISQKYTMGYVTRMGDDLKDELRNILAKNMDKGLGWEETAKDMVNNVDGMTKKRAITIARTESVRAKNLGQWAEHKEMGYKYFEVLPHSTACKKCKKAYIGVVFPMTGKFTVMLPPLHPRCRCAARFYKEVPAGYKVVRQVPEEYLPGSPKPKPKPETPEMPSAERIRQAAQAAAEDLKKAKEAEKKRLKVTDDDLATKFPLYYTDKQKLAAVKNWNKYPEDVKKAAIDNDMWVMKVGREQYYNFFDRMGKTEVKWHQNAKSESMIKYNVELTDLMKEYMKTPLALRKSTKRIKITKGRNDGTLGFGKYSDRTVELFTNNNALFYRGAGSSQDKSWRVVLDHEMGHCFDYHLLDKAGGGFELVRQHKYFSSLVDNDYFKAVQKDVQYLKDHYSGQNIDLRWGDRSFFHELKPKITDQVPESLNTLEDLQIIRKYAVSGYAKNSVGNSYLTENFADSMAFALNNPLKFKTYFPNQFKMIQEYIKQYEGMIARESFSSN
nr:minor capsid protein [uncultured Methanobacterium sp.]